MPVEYCYHVRLTRAISTARPRVASSRVLRPVTVTAVCAAHPGGAVTPRPPPPPPASSVRVLCGVGGGVDGAWKSVGVAEGEGALPGDIYIYILYTQTQTHTLSHINR